MKIINVVGARPNFMKMAPIIEAINRHPGRLTHLLVHTGQHYDERMSKAFFDGLRSMGSYLHRDIAMGGWREWGVNALK